MSPSGLRYRASLWVLDKIAHGLAGIPVVYGDRARLHADPAAVLNDALINTVSGTVTIEADAFFGHRVMLLTGTHELDAPRPSNAIPAAGRDIHVSEGAWLASGAIVIGPARIGARAVVAAGAVVLGDVEPGAIVGGVPARRLGTVPGGQPPTA